MKIILISMISSQSKDVVNIYIKFRLLLLIKYVLQKCIELVKRLGLDSLRVRLRHKISRHIETAIYT